MEAQVSLMIELELPWPPSVNHYYRHVGPRVLISREGRRYRTTVTAKLANVKFSKFICPVELHIELYPPDARRRDIDNVLKCLFDTLTIAGVYDDDSQIHKIVAIKREPMRPHGLAYVRVKKYDQESQETD